MQRSKAAVSVEVKRVIEALCRLLAAVGLEHVPVPDAFRRAKFGAEVEEHQFWQLLASILPATTAVPSEASRQQKPASEQRKLVAAGLWQTGYHADWMYRKDGAGCSSRDLLLALGWLLSRGILEKLLTQRVQQLDKTLLSPPPPVTLHVSPELQVDRSSLRRLQWLVGRLRHQGRSLLSMQEERACLLHAVCSASPPSSASVSSVDQRSTVLREVCAGLQELCDLLDAYLNWKQVEKVFWTWMDSVVDCHVKDGAGERPTLTVHRGVDVCHHGNRGLEKLEAMLLELDTAQGGWRNGKGDAEDRGARLQAALDTSSHLLLPSLSQPYRAKHQAEGPARRRGPPAEGPGDGAEDAGQLSASRAARLLLRSEARLLERRDRQRLANRMQLQEMIGRLDQLVLIPP